MSGILWVIFVGFVAGIIARILSPGPNNPSGFVLTTVLGIIGAFVATLIGQSFGPTFAIHPCGTLSPSAAQKLVGPDGVTLGCGFLTTSTT